MSSLRQAGVGSAAILVIIALQFSTIEGLDQGCRIPSRGCCPQDGELRLISTTSMGLGHVMIKRDGRLYRVCLVSMSTNIANHICRRLGYDHHAGIVPGEPYHGVYLNDNIYKTEASCRGQERCLSQCEGHSWWIVHRHEPDGPSCYNNSLVIHCIHDPTIGSTSRAPTNDPPVQQPSSRPPPADLPASEQPQLPTGPADQPLHPPTTWPAPGQGKPHDVPLYPVINYDNLPPLDPPLPRTRPGSSVFSSTTGCPNYERTYRYGKMEGEVRSPGYPSSYPDYIKCNWTLQVPTGQNVQLTIKEIQLGESDVLLIYENDSHGKLLNELSGSANRKRRDTSALEIRAGVSQILLSLSAGSSTRIRYFLLNYRATKDPSAHRSGPGEKRHDSTWVIYIILLIIIIVIFITILLCWFKHKKNKSEDKVKILSIFGSKSRISPYTENPETLDTENKNPENIWTVDPELMVDRSILRDNPVQNKEDQYKMDYEDEKPPPTPDFECSHNQKNEMDVPKESMFDWSWSDLRETPPAEMIESKPEKEDNDEPVVNDSVVIINNPKSYPPPKNVPLDSTIPKKTPPGQEQSKIGGPDGLAHLYKLKPNKKKGEGPDPALVLTSVPYAASMYNQKGGAIQFETKRESTDNGSGVRKMAPIEAVQTSSILASAAKKPQQNPTQKDSKKPKSKNVGSRNIASAKAVRKEPAPEKQPISIRSKSASTQRNRTVTSSGAQSSLTSPPPMEFLCPITKDVMRQPVKCSDGRSYERKAIIEWMETSVVSPTTGETIIDSALPIDIDLKDEIKAWKKERMEAVLVAAKSNVEQADGKGKSVGAVEC